MQSHDAANAMFGRSRGKLYIICCLALIVATSAATCRRAQPDAQPETPPDTHPEIQADAQSHTQPDVQPDATKPASIAKKLVSFPTSDGGLIYADEYGVGDKGVVLAHGGRFNKESWAEQARVLAGAGLRVLAIDLRGYGESRGGSKTQDGHYLDVLAAVRYLRGNGAKTVSVVGGSFGGGAAARASVEAEPGEIDRLVLLAHSAIKDPERMKGRKLFITTRGDFSGNGVLRLPRIREQYEKAPDPKKLVILDGSAHAQHIFKTEQGKRLMQEIQRFLSEP